MRINHPERVALYVAQDEATLERFDVEASSIPIPGSNAVVLGPKIRAHLHGEPFFTVTALQDDEQVAFERGGFTLWQWNVTPKVAGKQFLVISIDAYMNDGEHRRVKNVPINVKVTLADHVMEFLSSNWQWLWTAIFAPIAFAAWQFLKNRRKQDASDSFDDLVSKH